MTKRYMRILLVLVFTIMSLSVVYGTNNSSYIYSNYSSPNSSPNNSDNKTSYNGTLDNSYNQTTIVKNEENKTIVGDQKGSINDTSTKSRVVIKKYVKPKNNPGFDNMVTVLAIMIVIIYISARKRE